nr:HEPN domain-containing protein [Mesorhizobium sp. B2-8-3]
MRLLAPSSTLDGPPRIFEVYSTMKPHVRFPGSPPHPADLPIDPVRRPEEYSNVLTDWLKRAPSWMDARSRYSNSLRTQVFDIDRLVGSANMFDILPGSAVPKDIELSEDLIAARDQSRHIFSKLPDSAERSSILNALGRLGKSALKHKVRWRAAPIIEALGGKFPDLNWVLDEAVNCRNHYVHGTPSKVNYAANFQDSAGFFTKSLEFVFAVSDLIEAGWDVKAWAARSSSLTHPFFEYKHSYKANLAAAKALFAKI